MVQSRWWLDLWLGSEFVGGWLGGGLGAPGGPVDSWLAVLSLVVLPLGGCGPCRGRVVLALSGRGLVWWRSHRWLEELSGSSLRLDHELVVEAVVSALR